MEFSKLTAVSNLSGLYEVVARRPNGVFVRALDSTKTQFVSNHAHTFSPLDKISIYTTMASNVVELEDVLRAMIQKENSEELLIPPHNASPNILREYFYQILPNHDESRVHTGDIKKMIKWANILKIREIKWTGNDASQDTGENAVDTVEVATTDN